MKKKKLNKEEQEILQEKMDVVENFSEEQKENLSVLLGAEAVYEAVIEKLGLEEESEIFVRMVKNMLRAKTKDHLVFAIWNNLDNAQAKHLREYINQMAVIEPDLDYEEVLFRFAPMYPALASKVHESLGEFFRRFVENFKRLEE